MDIKIDIDDDRFFTDVAPVVDRDDFAKEIIRIRTALGVIVPLTNTEISQPISDDESKRINKEVEISRKRLLLPITFRNVITAIVFRNEVTDKDYSPAYLDSKLDSFDNTELTPDETFFIVLSPEARDEDVIKAFQKYRDQLGNENGAGQYKYIHQVWDKNKKKPSIKKYRNWYLATKSGIPSASIAEKEVLNCQVPQPHDTGKNKPRYCLCFDESTIRKGVSTYESLIGKTRTL